MAAGNIVTSLNVLEPEQLMEAIRDARLTPLQLSARPSPSVIARLVCSGACLDIVSVGPAMLFSGVMPAECYTLSFVLDCPGVAQSFNFCKDHGSGYMGFFPPGAPLDTYNPAGSVNAVLTIPVADFLAAATLHFPDLPDEILARGAGMRVGSAEQARLYELVALIGNGIRGQRDAFDDALLRRNIERELLEVFFNALRSGCCDLVGEPKMSIGRRYGRMQSARRYIADHLGQSIFLSDLGSELGISPRGVEYLFREFMGISPVVFVRNQRLHQVRDRLLNSPAKPGFVKKVAIECGFWHLGRFAKEYASLFGELPSETLTRTG